MIETRPMQVEDLLLIMEQNADIYPEFAALSDEQKRAAANLNILAGTAESFFEDGRLVGVGGIRYTGIGEAWLITPPDIRGRGLSLLREARRVFTETCDERCLRRCYAESKISDNFLKHIGFKSHPKGFIWDRS